MAHPHAIDGLWPSFRVFDLVIPTYYLIISFTFCVCLLWLIRRAQARQLEARIAIDTAIVIMISGFLGARIFHVIFEDLAYYQQNPIDILKFWNGGFVFFGGAFAAFICGVLFLKTQKQNVGDWLNLFAPISALGYALGRVACFVTGCCFGDVCELIPDYEFRHPTQLYAVVIELISLFILLKIENRPSLLSKKLTQIPGYLFCIWALLHSLGRIFMEFLRADPRGPMLWGLSISTWLSCLVLISLSIYYKSKASA